MNSIKSTRQALDEWEDLLQSIRNSSPVDTKETAAEKAKRIAWLEADPERWIEYHFKKYCFAKPAKFQIESTKRVLNRKTRRFYQRRAWSRGLSKTTRRMFEVLYLMLVRKMRINALLLSKNYENAERLLDTYMAVLEANQRIINDYGPQEKFGKWSHGNFTTRTGSTFRAVGSGQNPRGAKNEELRINVIIFDDVDDDEVCRNPDRLNLVWEWVEKSVLPTIDISGDYYVFFDNNIIAEDSIAVRAAAFADDVELVNIRDADGNSTWPEKNSEADIDEIEGRMSYEAFQQEYYNNPMQQGQTFKEITYGKCPPLKQLQFVVVYADPSPSNRDRPTAKSKAANSCKAVSIIGCIGNKYYLYKCWVDNTTNSNFTDWLFLAHGYVGNATQLYIYIENNTLQNPFYEQVLLPLIFQKQKEYGIPLMVSPDETIKPDKWFRIEGTLEPINRLGMLIFNEDEKDNPHMKRMESQFKTAKPTSKTLDGPDSVQGAVKIIQNKVAVASAGGIEVIQRTANNKRY